MNWTVNDTNTPPSSAFTGTAGATTGVGTHTSFASVPFACIIHQTSGTNAGQWERNYVIGYTPGAMTFAIPLANTYTTGAQILILRQYAAMAFYAGVTINTRAYDGTVGGIMAFCINGPLIINGTVNGAGRGFRGATAASGGSSNGKQGEGTSGTRDTASAAANANGGGGGTGAVAFGAGGGGGGGNAATGSGGSGAGSSGIGGTGGTSGGSADLATAIFGGGGGSGGTYNTSVASGVGGTGGGLVIFYARQVYMNTSTGYINVDGTAGENVSSTGGDKGGGGGGAGGSVLIYTNQATLGSNRITANGNFGGAGSGSGGAGGNGAPGRIAISQVNVIDGGTTSPTYYDKGFQIYSGTVS